MLKRQSVTGKILVTWSLLPFMFQEKAVFKLSNIPLHLAGDIKLSDLCFTFLIVKKVTLYDRAVLKVAHALMDIHCSNIY